VLQRLCEYQLGMRSNRHTSTVKATVPRDVDEYIAGLSEPARSPFIQLRAIVRSALPPGATETISYKIPAFKHEGRVLVWFAAFRNHCSLFPTASVIEAFKAELKGFSTSKGTVHFPTDKKLPAALIRKLVKARVAEAKAKERS